MKSKKILCIVMAVLLAASFTGCKKNSANTSSGITDSTLAAQTRNTINLLYCSSDSLNPYAAVTEINRQLCRLLYEPLVKTDNNYKPVNRLAASVEISGTKCTVTLGNAVFSDGSAVTSSDVIYSYHLAKASTTAYASKLYESNSITAVDNKTVVFSMAKGDPYFANLLDFPILKSGSEKHTDTDGVDLPPIGCGRYVVSEDREKLELNPTFFGTKGSVTTIQLVNAPDAESVSHYVEIGAADLYYSDISDGKILRMSGKKVDINLNNIVYIGINDSYGDLIQNYVRQALSSGIDRKTICRDAYYNNAIPATGFFNPLWEEVSSVQNIQSTADNEITIENLEKIGYNNLDSNGVRTNAPGAKLKFTLLVNSENISRVAAARLIASQLAVYGISIDVVEKSYADYVAALGAGDFQLYLAEVNITGNMDLSSVVMKGGASAYGIGKADAAAKAAADQQTPAATPAGDGTQAAPEEQANPEPVTATTVDDVINGFYSGNNTIADVASILQTEMAIIPVCYRTGILFYNENIDNISNSSVSDIYFSIESFNIKK